MTKKIVCFISCMILLVGTISTVLASSTAQTITLKGYSNEGYEYVEAGYYPYDTGGSERAVLWRVLSVENDGTALLQSAYVIDTFKIRKYTTSDKLLTEVTSTLFFPSRQKAAIMGISMLSPVELMNEDYGFTDDDARMITATPYASSKGISDPNGATPYLTYNGKQLMKVGVDGSLNNAKKYQEYGLVPTIRVSVKGLGLDEGSGTIDQPYYNGKASRNYWIENTFRINTKSWATTIIENEAHEDVAVYAGPGNEYRQTYSFRRNKVKVGVIAIHCKWAMIEYRQTNKPSKMKTTGWVHIRYILSEAGYNAYCKYGTIRNFGSTAYSTGYSVGTDKGNFLLDYFPNARIQGIVTATTDLWGDRGMDADPLFLLQPDTKVTLLAYIENENAESAAYVETVINEIPVCGFISSEALELDDYEAEALMNGK